MPEIPNSRIRKLRTWAPGKRSSELIGEDENKNYVPDRLERIFGKKIKLYNYFLLK